MNLNQPKEKSRKILNMIIPSDIQNYQYTNISELIPVKTSSESN